MCHSAKIKQDFHLWKRKKINVIIITDHLSFSQDIQIRVWHGDTLLFILPITENRNQIALECLRSWNPEAGKAEFSTFIDFTTEPTCLYNPYITSLIVDFILQLHIFAPSGPVYSSCKPEVIISCQPRKERLQWQIQIFVSRSSWSRLDHVPHSEPITRAREMTYW